MSYNLRQRQYDIIIIIADDDGQPQLQPQQLIEEQAMICQICFANRFDMVAVFCGHCLCQQCENQLLYTRCPSCRQEVAFYLQLYN